MNQDELNQLFDKQAESYDNNWKEMAPIMDGLHFFMPSILANLTGNANILCVGLGTGKELIYLAKKYKNWRFTAIDPSENMLDACRKSVEAAGLTSRCSFHHGYLETLPTDEKYDAATCFLVSQFILDPNARSAFFKQIANNLKPGGILVCADLVADTASENYDDLLALWMKVMRQSDISAEQLETIKAAYKKDVAIVPPTELQSIITAGGFNLPTLFYQAGMIHAFFATRSDITQ